MKKRAANSFIKGLNTDRHPLSAAPDEMVDAKNVDITAVSKGYQFILQKREGNEIVAKPAVAWNRTVTYELTSGVLYLGVLYESTVSNNVGNVPSPTSEYWRVVTEISAGMPSGYIPLALQEFNNVAYIISVNPTTGKTQLGTFPCPDYGQFLYINGDPIAGAVGPITNSYNSDLDQVEYAFSTDSSLYEYTSWAYPQVSSTPGLESAGYAFLLGPQRAVDPDEDPIPGPRVILTNIGLSTIDITIELPNDIVAIYNGTNIGTSISIPINESRLITFKLENAMSHYSAEVVRPCVVSFSSPEVEYTKTYSFSFKTYPTIFARDQERGYTSNSIIFGYAEGNVPYVDGTIIITNFGTGSATIVKNFGIHHQETVITYSNRVGWEAFLNTPVVNITDTAVSCTVTATDDTLGRIEHAQAVTTFTSSSGVTTVFRSMIDVGGEAV